MNNIISIKKSNIHLNLFNYKFIVLILFAIILIIGSILISYTSYATSGNTLEQYQSDAKALQDENTKLALQIANDTSLPQIEKRAQELGMSKNTQILVIKAK